MKTILIIEDDPQVQDIYREALAAAGYQIVQAFTGKEGLELMRRKIPDLLILDIMLPHGMNGFDVFEQIKQGPKLKDVPVMVLTNLDSEMKVSLEMGAKDYLVKANTTITKVLQKVREIIG